MRLKSSETRCAREEASLLTRAEVLVQVRDLLAARFQVAVTPVHMKRAMVIWRANGKVANSVAPRTTNAKPAKWKTRGSRTSW